LPGLQGFDLGSTTLLNADKHPNDLPLELLPCQPGSGAGAILLYRNIRSFVRKKVHCGFGAVGVHEKASEAFGHREMRAV
jgi:hypothetical protein